MLARNHAFRDYTRQMWMFEKDNYANVNVQEGQLFSRRAIKDKGLSVHIRRHRPPCSTVQDERWTSIIIIVHIQSVNGRWPRVGGWRWEARGQQVLSVSTFTCASSSSPPAHSTSGWNTRRSTMKMMTTMTPKREIINKNRGSWN